MLEIGSIEDLAESFNRFELEYGMFDKKINGIKFWQHIREEIWHRQLVQIFGFVIISDIKKIERCEEKINYTLWDRVKENLFCNQFCIGRRDVLIFACGRKVIDGNQRYRDVYTDIIDKKLKQSHYLLDFANGRPLPQASTNLVYIKLDQFKKFMGIKDEAIKISTEEFEKKVIEPLENYYHICFDNKRKKQMIVFLQYSLSMRRILIPYYNFILNRSKPKVIFIVGGDIEMGVLCVVAKKKGIPVVELQHGAVSQLSPHYNFQTKIKYGAYPDYVFVYSESEKRRCRFPIDLSRVIPVGYPELDEYTKKAANHKSKIKNILIISSVEEEVMQFARELADKIDRTRYRVVYKLHPIEYGNWKRAYGHYLIHPNIEVVGDRNTVAYDFLTQADWVIGKWSTLLREATAFNVKIAIIDSVYYEKLMSDLSEMGRARLIENVDDFMAIIDNKDIPSEASTDFFESNSMEKVQKAIDMIIASNAGV